MTEDSRRAVWGIGRVGKSGNRDVGSYLGVVGCVGFK